MAGISFSNGGLSNGGGVGQTTSGYMPINQSGVFVNSKWKNVPSGGSDIYQLIGSDNTVKVFNYNSSTDILTIGSTQSVNYGYVYIDILSGYLQIYMQGGLRIDTPIANTAGGASGKHLPVNINGTNYKIALLSP